MIRKPKSIKAQHKQVLIDIAYIDNTYGDLYDYCGGWCNSKLLNSMLKTPTHENAVEILISQIQQFFDSGYDSGRATPVNLPIDNDPKLQEIRARWLLIQLD